MDFINIIEEVPPWKNSDKTFKVFVSDPEEFIAYMVEVRPLNQRHLVDTISKFQPLLTWTSCSCFAQLLMAFQYDSKYFMIFEYFEEVSRDFSLEEMQNFLIEAETGLKHIHDKNSYHGDISEDCIKITKDSVKIIGWKLPKMRTFDPEPEINLFEEDFQNLRKVFAKISGFSIEELISCRYPSLKEQPKSQEGLYQNELLNQNPIFFISGKILKYFCNGSEGVVSQTTAPKGCCLSFFNRKLYRSGGDICDQSFFEYSFELNSWMETENLLSPHKYHTSIEYNNELWVLAGIRSNKVEKFDGKKWFYGPELPECLENPTSSIGDTLYLYSKGIFKLSELNWVKLGVLQWVGFQGLYFNESKFLILGGRTATTYNENVLILDTTTGMTEKYVDGITGLYGLFSFDLSSSRLKIVNNAGKVRFFDFPSLKLTENS